LATVSRRSPSEVFPGLVASGKIALRGNVAVNGIGDLVSGTAVDAGIYSGQTATGTDLVSWKPNNAGDRAIVDGEVGVGSVDPDTMNFGSDPTAYSVKNFKTEVTGLDPVFPDIESKVAGQSSHPAPPLQPFGTTVISSGEYYHSGNINLNGDVILDGGTLYVDGNLEVNGSIKGEGALYVTGDTSFFGDAAITAKQESLVVVYSKGDVRLSGFDGTAYIEAAAAADPQSQGVVEPD
jgi:hypothetical protein